MIVKTNNLVRIAHIYYRYVLNSAKVHFYYNDVSFTLLGMIARDSVGVFMIYFLTYRFESIDGWNSEQLVFLYSLLYLSYGLSMLIFAGVRFVEKDIHKGTFDRYMVTPLNVFMQAIVGKVDLMTTISYCALGSALFVYASDSVDLIWSGSSIVYLAFALIGGVLIQSSLLLFSSIVSFWAIRTGEMKFILFFNIRRLAIYPLGIYPQVVQFMLIYIFPFAFVNYFPSKYLLAGQDTLTFSPVFSQVTFLVGMVLSALIYAFWSYGIANYKSTGN